MNAQPSPSARPLRLGFLGLGWIGRQRLTAVANHPEIQVAALSDASAERVQSAAEQFPQAFVANDIDQLLRRALDGVVIATPNAFHCAQALACLQYGLPVFCQKPLAINAVQTAKVVAAAKSANCLLGIDFCYRHVHGMQELRRRVSAGELGTIVSIDLEFHNAYSPDKSWCRDKDVAGGGCLLDLGVHLLDLALWLQNGCHLQLTTAHLFESGRRVRGCDGAIEDVAVAEFAQANCTTRLACSWNAHIGQGASISMRLLGTAGGAHWHNVNGSFYDFQLELTRADAIENIGAAPDEWGPRALLSWARQLQRDTSFDPSAALAVRSAELIDEAYRA